ncbi:MAG: hypothetical protein K1Y01_14645 [Vicinamibacteria bacterium]|nr:hypothetical protein [Vicinamibacteria bacterium]
MTLVLGVRCKDGFVIAADSQETTSTKSHVDKVVGFDAGDWQLVIGCCGYSVAVFAVADLIEQEIRRMDGPALADAESIIRERLREYAQDYMSPETRVELQLAIGYRDRNSVFNLWRSEGGHLAPVQNSVVMGTGQAVGNFAAEQLLPEARFLTTANAHHLAVQILRASRRDPYVGGDNCVWAVRRDHKAKPFFDFGEPEFPYRYIWGLQELLGQAINSALSSDRAWREGILETIGHRLSKIHRPLRRLSPKTLSIREKDLSPHGPGKA